MSQNLSLNISWEFNISETNTRSLFISYIFSWTYNLKYYKNKYVFFNKAYLIEWD